MNRAFYLSLAVAALPLWAQDATVDLLRKLADAPGPPGFEEPCPQDHGGSGEAIRAVDPL